jgi:hypothetical protein
VDDAPEPPGHGATQPDEKSRIEAMQITLELGGPDVQRQLLADQMNLWGQVVKEHNIKADSS